jgi:RNA polymerase sigma-70 factor, ECF subfamily
MVPLDDATALLAAVSSGNLDARKELFPLLYNELHALARQAMRREKAGNILQTTALINEAFIHLVKSKEVRCRNSSHFFSIAAKAMRQILVSEARRRMAAKRGGGIIPLSIEKLDKLDTGPPQATARPEKLERLDSALEKLESIKGQERLCSVIELEFFAGLSHEEAANVLGVSKATVRRDWEFAKVWLLREMKSAE